MRSRVVRARTTLVLLAVLTAVAGCSASPVSKAGDPVQVTLSMANVYYTLTYQPAVASFVEQVDERSEGLLAVKVTHAVGDFRPDAEQRGVEAVAAGDFDLAWVGTRVLDTVGVRSFAARTAPMLVDSYELEAAVLGSELPARMLPDLDRVGVRGLALLAGGLRKPIAVDGPLLRPEDWRGTTFAAFRSDAHAAAIRALSATPTDVFATDLDRGLADGTIHGFEKNLLAYSLNSLAPAAPHVTLNANLWPETVVLVASPRALGRLTEAQEGWLRQAASDASEESAELADVDQALLSDLCRMGARFSTASPADLAALRSAMAPVYAELEQDPGTAASLLRIEEIKRSVDVGELRVPDGCEGPAG